MALQPGESDPALLRLATEGFLMGGELWQEMHEYVGDPDAARRNIMLLPSTWMVENRRAMKKARVL